MLQLVALLAVSWLLLWIFGKKNLTVLGLVPGRSTVSQFFKLFFVTAAISASAFLLRVIIVKETYILDKSLSIGSFLMECWHQFRTVMTEELLCRGAILYILIRKAGQKNAIIISSVFFALLHWLNSGVLGNISQMLLLFAFTCTMGLLLAYAYARTFSLLIPFAIHFGWNLVQNYIFPGDQTGNHVFKLLPAPEVTISYTAFFIMLLAPKLAVLLVNYLIIKRYRQVQIP